MTQAAKEFDIAIIGGGMVGTSLASILSAAHPAWQIALIEAQPLQSATPQTYTKNFDARSTALAFGSVDIFEQLGLWTRLQRHATAIRQVHVSDRGHFAGSLIDADEQGVTAVGYVVENAWLAQALMANVQQQQNIHCFSPARVNALVPQQNGNCLRVVDGDQTLDLECQLTVIADGGDSPLRRSLGIEVDVADYQQTAIITNVAFSQPHHNRAYERFTEQGPLALLPLGESSSSQYASLIWTLPKSDAEQTIQLSDAEFLTQLQQRFGYRLGIFERVGERYAYPLQLTIAREQIRSHTVLMGNAAHFLHPVAGQGFNLALRDCVSLAAALLEAQRDGKSPGALTTLQNYISRQQRDQQLTIAFSDRLVRLFSTGHLPLMALRHLGFIGLAGLPIARNMFAAQAMGMAGRNPRWNNSLGKKPNAAGHDE